MAKKLYLRENEKKLQKKYNEWRSEAEKHNKQEKKVGGSHPTWWTWDCGEASAREDFSEYAGLEEITFEEMLELERAYE